MSDSTRPVMDYMKMCNGFKFLIFFKEGLDPPTSRHPTNFTDVPPTNYPANILYNKYVVIGVLVFFVALFLVAVVLHLVRSKLFCKDNSLDVLYAEVSSDPDASSLAGSDDDNNLAGLCTTCQLHVADDDEVYTGSTDDFEYDCSSLDGGLSATERKTLVSVLRGDFKSDVVGPPRPHLI